MRGPTTRLIRLATTEREGTKMRMQGERAGRGARLLIAAVVVAVAMAAMAPFAQAEFGISSFENAPLNSDETAALQAGEHPFEVVSKLDLNSFAAPPFGAALPDESLRDAEVEMPAGFVGSTTAVPKCSIAELAGNGLEPTCQDNTQVGVLELEIAGPFAPSYQASPLYNIESPYGVPASFAANVLGVPVYLNAEVRSGTDYGVTVSSRYTNQTLPILSSIATIWGTPADSAHDDQRCHFLSYSSEPFGYCNNQTGEDRSQPHPFVGAAKGFLTNPADCAAGPFTSEVRADSWAQPGAWDYATDTVEEGGAPVGIAGCEEVPFEPTMTVAPESHQAGAPTGLKASISIPAGDLENPAGIAQSSLKDATVTFPQGMAVNTASADGLGSCSEAQFDWHSANPSSCPADSKLGTVEIETPLLENTLQGSVYLATQGTNPFKSLIALYISVADPVTGIVLKIPGKVSPDPSTGQLTATFDDAPQLPFAQFDLRLKGGNRAALVNPPSCGTYTTEASLAGWANPQSPVSSPSSFTIDQGCGNDAKFTPGFAAGTTNPIAGQSSPFTLRVTRPDGQQNVATIQATLPEGVLAKLAGVQLCGDSDAASGNCPAASQVGSATVGTGAGTNPLYVPQPGKAPTAVYLAGPYKGAPYSLVAKVPAQAGPFDLGTVAVRNTIDVNPTNAQVSVKSDPLPQILQGIPISYRDIRVDVDRSDFTLNPTSCNPMEVRGTIGSANGQSANVSDRFQVASCEALRFKPNLKLSVKGPTHRNAHPRFKAVLTMPKGANIQKAQVTLPKTELLENAHIRTICTRVQYAAGNGGGEACPKASIYGRARAWSPLLDKPLEGPVYLRSSSHQLPDLVASLDGQIHIDLVGRIDAVHARIRNTFEGVPDAPVSRFVLEMQGGKKGLLANNTELCKTTPRAAVKFDAHSGKLADSNPVMRAQCGKARKQAKKRSAHRRGGKGAGQGKR